MFEKLPESLGQALSGQRAGIEKIVFHRLLSTRDLPALSVKSSAFENLQRIPIMYTADGAGLSPPIEWRNVPDTAVRVVLIVEDADSPTPQPLVHGIAIVEGRDGSLNAGGLASPDHAGAGVETGLNSFLGHAWLPPDPPPGHGDHRYAFQIFALDSGHQLSAGPGRGELIESVMQHATAAGCVIGLYAREQRIKVDDEAGDADIQAGELA